MNCEFGWLVGVLQHFQHKYAISCHRSNWYIMWKETTNYNTNNIYSTFFNLSLWRNSALEVSSEETFYIITWQVAY